MGTGEYKKTMKLPLLLLFSALLFTGVQVPWAMAEVPCQTCLPCHGNMDAVHGNYNHSATVGSGIVAIFADTGHDDSGREGDRPFFGISVNCGICHNNDLPTIHGNDCATCHPSPYDTLGVWGRGCQQGGCHSFYHQGITQAHAPFEDSGDSANDCNVCHGAYFEVQQANCLNCHSQYVAGDVAPPVTTANVQPLYAGTARIDFSVMDNGKVGIGRSFYRLDGGPVTPVTATLIVSEAGTHELEYWSIDQSGNTETVHKHASFTIELDTTPPVTTSNAEANKTYYQGATINLTATDSSAMGVKTTWYKVNDGAFQAGNKVVIPATSGSFSYTLTFYSEDWSGNIESQKTVSFTVISGTGTTRLVWGNSDVSGSPCASNPDAEAFWTIRRGGAAGPVAASGSGACPNWSGVNNISLLVSATPYYVIVDWWESDGEYYDQTVFPNVSVGTPGAVIRVGY